MYIIRDTEAGNKIDEFPTLELAEQALRRYYEQDLEDGVFVPDFYEIVDGVDYSLDF